MAPPHVMIGTPAMDGKLCAQYAESLIYSQSALQKAQIAFSVKFELQDSLVMSARNAILAAFRRSKATDLLFIDSDIGWDPSDLMRVLNYDVPLVAGVYPRKSESLSFTIRFIDPTMVQAERSTGLIAAKQVGAGFLRLRRDCLEQMIGAYEDLRYEPPPISGEAEPRYALFDTSIEEGEFVGEDFTFCNRWRAIGGTVWVDPDLNLRHYGSRVFSGVLRQVLAQNPQDRDGSAGR